MVVYRVKCSHYNEVYKLLFVNYMVEMNMVWYCKTFHVNMEEDRPGKFGSALIIQIFNRTVEEGSHGSSSVIYMDVNYRNTVSNNSWKRIWKYSMADGRNNIAIAATKMVKWQNYNFNLQESQKLHCSIAVYMRSRGWGCAKQQSFNLLTTRMKIKWVVFLPCQRAWAFVAADREIDTCFWSGLVMGVAE